jgi:hypothetical protein
VSLTSIWDTIVDEYRQPWLYFFGEKTCTTAMWQEHCSEVIPNPSVALGMAAQIWLPTFLFIVILTVVIGSRVHRHSEARRHPNGRHEEGKYCKQHDY